MTLVSLTVVLTTVLCCGMKDVVEGRGAVIAQGEQEHANGSPSSAWHQCQDDLEASSINLVALSLS